MLLKTYGNVCMSGVTTYLFSDGELQQGDEGLIELFKQQDSSLLWIDICGANIEEHQPLLLELGCHPLAIQDGVVKEHQPKIEYFDDNVLILYRDIHAIQSALVLEREKLAFLVFERVLITLHRNTCEGIEQAKKTLLKRGLNKSPLHLALKIMRLSADVYIQHVLEFEDILSGLEDGVSKGDGEQVMSDLISHRSNLQKLMRQFNYQINITSSLSNDEEFDGWRSNEKDQHEITDLHDRFERLTVLSNMQYEISGDLLDGFLSLSSHRLNESMRILTVIMSIFVPLSFLTGFYGMNFEYMPELKYKYSYFIFVGFLVSVAAGLLFWFKRKKWL